MRPAKQAAHRHRRGGRGRLIGRRAVPRLPSLPQGGTDGTAGGVGEQTVLGHGKQAERKQIVGKGALLRQKQTASLLQLGRAEEPIPQGELLPCV